MAVSIKKSVASGIEVQTADIQNSAITTAKLALSAGKWATGTFTSADVTWTGTSAFTVLDFILRITAATCTSACKVIVQDTAGNSILTVAGTSAGITGTFRNTAGPGTDVSAVSASNTTAVEIAAGKSIQITQSGAITNKAGKYYMMYIATPS